MSPAATGAVGETYRLPIQESIRDLLADLLGKAVRVAKEAKALGGAHVAVVAEYVDDDDATAALAVCDAGFANRVGAALTMVPPRVADDNTRDGAVPANLLDNLQEVLNIMARLFNTAASPHVRLRAVHPAGELPESVAALLAAPVARRDFGVSLDGYGDGRLVLIVA